MFALPAFTFLLDWLIPLVAGLSLFNRSIRTMLKATLTKLNKKTIVYRDEDGDLEIQDTEAANGGTKE